MIPAGDDRDDRYVPVVMYTIIALNVILFLVDRRGHLFGPQIVFPGLAAVPAELSKVVAGGGEGSTIVTIFTSMFLHGDLAHLLGNMLFLLVFGGGVESAFGPIRFMLYYLFWGFAATGAHVFVNPSDTAYVLGASGAIGGVLGCYFLLFPASRVDFFVFPLPIRLQIHAWILLGFWFVYQILFPQIGVANWAHAGGFLVGMLTVLIAGGRNRILEDQQRGTSLNPRPLDNSS
jgi:membrane associated rhomboid family serine protease